MQKSPELLADRVRYSWRCSAETHTFYIVKDKTFSFIQPKPCIASFMVSYHE